MRDFVALSESTTFEAYRLVMCKARRPFDAALRASVLERARLMLVHAMQGRGTNFGEWRMRRTGRRAGTVWTAWESTVYSRNCHNPDTEGIAIAKTTHEHLRLGTKGLLYPILGQDIQQVILPQEKDLERDFRAELEADLAAVLTPVERAVMTAHYLDGKPQREIARELSVTDARYRGPKGLRRAETRVNVLLHRARTRARTRLDPKWAVRAREAVA